MKKILLLMVAVFIFSCIQSNAAVTVEQVTEPDYVINNGYSEATAEEIMIIKSRVNGRPAEPVYDKGHNRFVRFCRNVYGYIDPAQDTDERIHHNIKTSPNVKDL